MFFLCCYFVNKDLQQIKYGMTFVKQTIKVSSYTPAYCIRDTLFIAYDSKRYHLILYLDKLCVTLFTFFSSIEQYLLFIFICSHFNATVYTITTIHQGFHCNDCLNCINISVVQYQEMHNTFNSFLTL